MPEQYKFNFKTEIVTLIFGLLIALSYSFFNSNLLVNLIIGGISSFYIGHYTNLQKFKIQNSIIYSSLGALICLLSTYLFYLMIKCLMV